jgi:hypothetical protein
MSLRRFLTNTRPDPDRSSLQSGRPPTYTSNVTAPPIYTGVGGSNDGVRAWSENVPSPSVLSAPDSQTLLDGTESSFTDTVSVAERSAEVATHTGPRYSKRPCHVFVSHL